MVKSLFIESKICVIMASRPAALTVISNSILPRNVLATLDCIPRELYGKMTDGMEWLRWLAENRLVRNGNVCGNCRLPTSLTHRAESPDGFTWKWRPCNTRVKCSHRIVLCKLWDKYTEHSDDDLLLDARGEGQTCQAV